MRRRSRLPQDLIVPVIRPAARFFRAAWWSQPHAERSRQLSKTAPFNDTRETIALILSEAVMNLTIDLSEQDAAVLEAQARAARMSAERYLSQIVARALERQHRRN